MRSTTVHLPMYAVYITWRTRKWHKKTVAIPRTSSILRTIQLKQITSHWLGAVDTAIQIRWTDPPPATALTGPSCSAAALELTHYHCELEQHSDNGSNLR